MIALLDFTGSFNNTSREFTEQLDNIVDRAVLHNAPLTVLAFRGSVAGVTSLLVCPSTTPKANNDSVAKKRRPAVAASLRAALRELASHPDANGTNDPKGPGTDIAGAWQAVSQRTPLATRRIGIMLTDGVQTVKAHPVRLTGIEASMYDVGRGRGVADTGKANELVEIWKKFLTASGVVNPVVVSEVYAG
ncbi:hypothetical protein [Frankia sp. AgKG'84/4]|uniref:hypothetical protein n=1 Tax=Frankia sp. AgKG'84/4 TaxID=573490 RepID=UPI00200DEEC3|nr:hypothetical protein [Frankia sp. AgKG'84/4]MCL9795596.1 hypothetical protein [Frankia sp. AgKG'84/4]